MSKTKQTDWWNRRSAAEDAEDDESFNWLDEYRSGGHGAVEDDRDAVQTIWSKYGSRQYDADFVSTLPSGAIRVIDAHRVVQGFVDTFATGDTRYRVTFSEAIATAGTDFTAKNIVISQKPLFDSAITDEQANTILTAMATHEASHVRYGLDTATAVMDAQWGGLDAEANTLSNLLDDVRIERRFSADYPGYASIFTPMLEYVARSNGGAINPAKLDGPLSFAIAAVRYAFNVAWTPETESERDWWTSWSARYSKTDSVTDHVAGVRAGLDHLKAQPQEQGKGQPQPGKGSLPACAADGVDQAAGRRAGGSMTDRDAQNAVEQGKFISAPDADTGKRGEIYWSSTGIRTPHSPSRAEVERSGSAVAAIRSAFARSRTGHYATTRGLKTGRLDSKSLSRIASHDYRLFSRKTAPSEGRYRVWLLVDCSGSMTPRVDSAIAVSGALASAVRFLPNVALDIFGWQNGWRGMGSFGVARVYADGGSIAGIGDLAVLVGGGTPDGLVLRWAVKAIQEQVRPGEQPVIIMASDGVGSLSTTPSASKAFIDKTRKSGVQVVSVAFENLGSFQPTVYGAGNYIGWKGSIDATAKPLGDLVARIASGK